MNTNKLANHHFTEVQLKNKFNEMMNAHHTDLQLPSDLRMGKGCVVFTEDVQQDPHPGCEELSHGGLHTQDCNTNTLLLRATHVMLTPAQLDIVFNILDVELSLLTVIALLSPHSCGNVPDQIKTKGGMGVIRCTQRLLTCRVNKLIKYSISKHIMFVFAFGISY